LLGKQTGVVIECGEDNTRIVPVCDGQVLVNSVRLLEFGGCHISKAVSSLINKKGDPTRVETGSVHHFKENRCYVSQDFANESAKAGQLSSEFKLLNGKTVVVPSLQLFAVTEPMFTPSLTSYSASSWSSSSSSILPDNSGLVSSGSDVGLAGLVARAIRSCDFDDPTVRFRSLVVERSPSFF
jgi:actin-related protein